MPLTYVKLPKAVSDYAVGVQSVNQALENNIALYDQYDLRHSVGVGVPGSNSSDPFLGPGRHDDWLVARTSADYEVDASGPTVVAYGVISGPLIVGAPEFVTDGTWRIYVATPTLYGVVATIKAAATGDKYAQCRLTPDLEAPYISVTTWDVASGALDNLSFSIVLWAENVV